MGYSARYHATSLIAVFLALAIGILIGAEFGGDALTSTRKNLEHSLVGNLQDARSQDRRTERRAGPRRTNSPTASTRSLTRDRLEGKRIGDRRPRRPAERRHRRGRGGAGRRPGRSWSGSGSCASRSTSTASPATSPRPASPTSQRNPDALTALGVGRRPPAGARRHPARSRPRPPLLARQRQLRRPRRGDRRPQPARRTWARSSAPPPSQLESGAAERDHGDADAGGRGRDLDRRTVLDLLLPGQRPLQRRRRRADRRASWRWSSRCSAPRAASASRAAPTGCCRTC